MNDHIISFSLSPTQLQKNTILTIRCNLIAFSREDYYIKDESGKIIRKGLISGGQNSFSLSTVGMNTGSYQFVVGGTVERFTIV